MKVRELITLLQRCDPECTVMYDASVGIRNEALTVHDDMGEEQLEPHFSVDDVQVGHGTIRGFVYLTEENI